MAAVSVTKNHRYGSFSHFTENYASIQDAFTAEK